MTQDLFDLFEESREKGLRNYIKAGTHLLRIEGMQLTQPGFKGTFVAIKLRVVKSAVHPAGDILSFMPYVGPDSNGTLDKQRRDMGLANVRAVIAAALGARFADVSAEHFKRAVSDDQPLTGMFVSCCGVNGLTSKKVPIVELAWVSPTEAEVAFGEGLMSTVSASEPAPTSTDEVPF